MKLEVNHKTMYNYVEFSFCLPINDVFYEKWDVESLIFDGKEINFICEKLYITISKEKIESDFWNMTNNVLIYHNHANPEIFLYFDLIRDPHDQCDMVYFGVRCNVENDEIIRNKLLELYKKSNPRSNFEIDYFNQSLYMQVFNSEFYFYKLDKNKNRQLIHLNID